MVKWYENWHPVHRIHLVRLNLTVIYPGAVSDGEFAPGLVAEERFRIAR